jgi:hypothetical protein
MSQSAATWRHTYETGMHLSADEATRLEKCLLEDGDDDHITTHVRLAGHYLSHELRGDSRGARRWDHIHWLISHHPEVSLEGHGSISPQRSQVAYDEGKRRWLVAVATHPNDVLILRNAVNYVLLYDRNLAEELVDRAITLCATDSYWHEVRAFLRLADIDRCKPAPEHIPIARSALAEFAQAIALEPTPLIQHQLRIGFARAAFVAGEHVQAATSAGHLLLEASTVDPQSLYCASHWAHVIFGRLALTVNNVTAARLHLEAASRDNHHFGLGQFGPDLCLASELLDRGESLIVIEYLGSCKRWLPEAADEFSAWQRGIEQGENLTLTLETSSLTLLYGSRPK